METLKLNKYSVLAKYCADKGYKIIAYGDGKHRVKVINNSIPKYVVINYLTSSSNEILLQLNELELK